MFRRSDHGLPQHVGLAGRHDAGGDIVVEREDRDGRLADREDGRRHHRRQQPLEPLSRFGQLGRHAGTAGMNLGADMVRNEPHDALAIGGRETLAGIGKAARQPVDPEPAVGVEHHLDDGRIFEPGRDRRAERGAQHARAARDNFSLEGVNRHEDPVCETARRGR